MDKLWECDQHLRYGAGAEEPDRRSSDEAKQPGQAFDEGVQGAHDLLPI
jgi:hypothetical protein